MTEYCDAGLGGEIADTLIYLDFGAKAIDWRGLYKNPGA